MGRPHGWGMRRKTGLLALWVGVVGCFDEPGGLGGGTGESSTGTTDAEATSGDTPGTLPPASSSMSGSAEGTSGTNDGSSSSTAVEETETAETSTSGRAESGSGSSSTGSVEPVCGDGNVDPGEACDGTDPANSACNDDCELLCETGFVDCNTMGADGCEAELASDGAHCGGCGNVCLSDACSDSECEPIVIATEQIGGPGEILRSGEFIVWSEGSFGAIRSWSVETQMIEELVTDDDVASTHSFAIVGHELYVLDIELGTIFRTAVDGSTSQQFVFQADGAEVLAADTENLYFGVNGDLYRFALGGGVGDETLIFTGAGEPLCQLTVTSSRALWPLFTGGDHQSVAPDGTTPLLLDTSAPNPCIDRPQASSAFVYYLGPTTDGGNNYGISRYTISDGTKEVLVDAPNPFSGPHRFVVNAGQIAAVTQASVLIYDLDGSNPVVVRDEVMPLGVYADDGLVVWGEDDLGSWSLLALEL